MKEVPASPEPAPPSEPSVLRELPALDRLNREATLPSLSREYAEDSLLNRASSMERAYRGDGLMRDVASRNQGGFRDPFRDVALPRVRTPDSDSAYQRYNSLLRGRSPDRLDRDDRYPSRGATPELRYRARSLERDLSPQRLYRRDDSEDEEDDDNFVAEKVREYYSSTLRTNASRPSAHALPEPKKTYKDNPKDLSI